MDGKTPETCWAVNKRQDNKLKKLLHQVGDLFELNVKLWFQKVKHEPKIARFQYGLNGQISEANVTMRQEQYT